MKKAYHMVLFSNRACLIFDDKGGQIVEYQLHVGYEQVDKDLALKATEEATIFEFAKLSVGIMKLTREEMQSLLGVHSGQVG
jgi:hypothetical protein